MNNGPVDCVIKTPVSLQIGDTVTDMLRPGVYVTDIAFPNGKPIKVQEISFKNYYSAFLSVRLLRREEGNHEGAASAKWVTCLRNFPLMANPHTEAGSQDYFSVFRQQMLVEPDNVYSVRLILRQPSSSWLNFSIDEIKIYDRTQEDAQRGVPTWLSSLTNAAEPLLLHVDGCYDINLLSYT
ncbi:nicolin-1 isoform X2 [Alosa alosa]|uniref:nicolin-1 isoform X2 n=1 Tax=Alosa alosa TaxID=278164 RepID=UPI0020153DDD|nr:nicolin-1 isoform X2 [Alosa alosa]